MRWLLLPSLLALACSDPAGPELPLSRTQAIDSSRVTAALRAEGGGVFVQLTAEPTSAALDRLRDAGLLPPFGRATLVTFPALRIRTVAGVVRAGGVRALARVPFVTRIEPSADRDGIGY